MVAAEEATDLADMGGTAEGVGTRWEEETRWEDLEIPGSKEGLLEVMVGLGTLVLPGAWEVKVALDLVLEEIRGDLGATVDLEELGEILEEQQVTLEGMAGTGEERGLVLGEATGAIAGQEIRIGGIKSEDEDSFMSNVVVRV